VAIGGVQAFADTLADDYAMGEALSGQAQIFIRKMQRDRRLPRRFGESTVRRPA
jgi:hypothetical protein